MVHTLNTAPWYIFAIRDDVWFDPSIPMLQNDQAKRNKAPKEDKMHRITTVKV